MVLKYLVILAALVSPGLSWAEPSSTFTQESMDLKANLAGPTTFTATVYGTGQPGAKAKMVAGDETVPDGAWRTLNLDTEIKDVGGVHSVTSSSSSFVAQGDGWYSWDCNVVWDASSTGERWMKYLIDGVDGELDTRAATGTGRLRMSQSKKIYLLSGQSVECQVRQDSGGDLAIRSGDSVSAALVKGW